MSSSILYSFALRCLQQFLSNKTTVLPLFIVLSSFTLRYILALKYYESVQRNKAQEKIAYNNLKSTSEIDCDGTDSEGLAFDYYKITIPVKFQLLHQWQIFHHHCDLHEDKTSLLSPPKLVKFSQFVSTKQDGL